MNRRDFQKACVLALLGMVSAPAAQAADYPTRPIRLIVPFAPGGPTDLLSRAYGSALSKILKQPVVVDNKPGAGGNIGVNAIVQAPPDGYTIGVATNGPLAINVTLFKNLPYNPTTDIAPITRLVFLPNVIVVTPAMGVKTFGELIRLIKENPGKYSYGSGGSGTSQHMAGERLKVMAGLDLLHVAYRGEAPAIVDLMGGQTSMAISSLAASLPQIKAGRLIPLAVTSTERSPILPDVPTVAESGFPGYEGVAWYGIVAPAKTPPEIINILQKASLEAFQSDTMQETIKTINGTLAPTTPEAFGAFIRLEIDRWAPIVNISGATAD